MSACIADPWNKNGINGSKFTLWDAYSNADLVTYPSLTEGFGNAFLEAVYFKKPLLINRYETFVRDIEPLGFDLIIMDKYLTDKTIHSVKEMLEYPLHRRNMTNANYHTAAGHFSYTVLDDCLKQMMKSILRPAFNRFPLKSSMLPHSDDRNIIPYPATSRISPIVREKTAECF